MTEKDRCNLNAQRLLANLHASIKTGEIFIAGYSVDYDDVNSGSVTFNFIGKQGVVDAIHKMKKDEIEEKKFDIQQNFY